MVVLPSFDTSGAVLPLTDGRYYRSGGRGQRYCCLEILAPETFCAGAVEVAVVPLERYYRSLGSGTTARWGAVLPLRHHLLELNSFWNYLAMLLV